LYKPGECKALDKVLFSNNEAAISFVKTAFYKDKKLFNSKYG
jgi:hypothetical protein